MPFTPYHFGLSGFLGLAMRSRRFVAGIATVSVACWFFADCAGGSVASPSGGGIFIIGRSSSEEFSENGKFCVKLEKPFPAANRTIEVFDVNYAEEKLIWSTTAPPGTTGGAVVSNDGRYVVVVDRRKKPRGNVVVLPRENVVELFCQGKGEVGGYSPQDIRDLAGELERTDIYSGDIPGELSVRSSHAIFHNSNGRTYFCLGLWGGDMFHWLVWDPGNGEHIKVDEAFAAEVLEDAYRRCREQTRKRQRLHCGFLAKLKRPEDRPLLEELLGDDNFYSVAIGGASKKPWTARFFKRLGINIASTKELDFIYADSHARGSADRALAQWDGKKLPYISPRDCYYHFLGEVRVDVVVPANPKHRGGLWVYLLPESVAVDQWDRERPVHYLKAEFKGLDSRLKLGRTIPCVFRSVTPGKYWVKAVWDAKKPFYQEKDTFYRGQKGDCESVARQVLEVKASRTTDVGKIECKQKVKGQ